MAAPSVTHTFANSTTADATQVNTNFTDIINGITDGTKDLSISALTCAGNATFNGNVTLGNSGADDITVTGSLASSIPVKTTYSYDIGTSTIGIRKIYFGSDDSGAFTTALEAGTNASSYTLKLPDADGAAKDYVQTDGSGQLSFVGGPGITSKTTTYTATTADKVISVTTGSAWTLTLYAASGNAGRTIKIIKTSSDTNLLTIDGNGAETINGSATYLISDQYEFVEIMCDGSNWVVINKGIGAGSELRVHTGNGHGSTRTKVRRFTTTATNTGGAFTYADSSTNGASVTINVDGRYCVMFTNDANGSGDGNNRFGVSLNSTGSGTTDYDSLAATAWLGMANIGDESGELTNTSVWTGPLSASDVLMPHDDGNGTNNTTVVLYVSRVG
jgi:hypothetical protein